MSALASITRSFSHLFFPDLCYGCGTDLVNHRQMLCLRCLKNLPYTNYHLLQGNPVEKIFWGRLPVENAASLFYFTKGSIVEKLLHQLKYRGKKEIGIYCGRLIGSALKESSSFMSIDSIVPLPLHRKKQHKRGYNQAKLICDGMSLVMNRPVLDQLIERVSETETQTHKNRIERWENMKDRFRLVQGTLPGNQHILLVDDVITTGATLEACAAELVKAGFRVSIISLAYSSSKNV